MASWHRSRGADIGLRASGLILCGIAYAAIVHLAAMHIASQSGDPIAIGLAAIGFLAASSGSAAIILGRHLFDEIEVSSRWRHRSGGA